MFYSMNELRKHWGIRPTQILHVGAHRAEELNQYENVGAEHIYWVEAQPRLAKELLLLLDKDLNTVIEAAVWHEDGVKLKFNLASNSESSSFFELGTHQQSYPEVKFQNSLTVETKKLDSILGLHNKVDFVNLDIQGAELNALKGFTDGLANIKWLYSEVNYKMVYEGCPNVYEIDSFLTEYGFIRKSVRWWKTDGWGDALYIHSSIPIPRGIKSRIYRFTSQVGWNLMRFIRIAVRK